MSRALPACPRDGCAAGHGIQLRFARSVRHARSARGTVPGHEKRFRTTTHFIYPKVASPGSPSGVVYAAWWAAGVGASCASGVTAGSGRDTSGRCHTCFQWGRKGLLNACNTRYFLGMTRIALLEKMRRFYVTDIDTATRYPYLLRVATKDPSSVRLHRLKKKGSHSAKVGTQKKVHFFGMTTIALSI